MDPAATAVVVGQERPAPRFIRAVVEVGTRRAEPRVAHRVQDTGHAQAGVAVGERASGRHDERCQQRC